MKEEFIATSTHLAPSSTVNTYDQEGYAGEMTFGFEVSLECQEYLINQGDDILTPGKKQKYEDICGLW